VSVSQNIYNTKTTTICTDYICRKQARAIRLTITSAPKKYTYIYAIQNDFQAIIFMLTQWIYVCFHVLEIFDWVS